VLKEAGLPPGVIIFLPGRGSALGDPILSHPELAAHRGRDGRQRLRQRQAVNDKPAGAVVGQQPFGGSRATGTNDEAGSLLNLLRQISPRTMKETFDPPTDFACPYMGS
jgi:1-pyrroline-5-carboxylate dehydrogenase